MSQDDVLIADLLDLPDRVYKGDFVLDLTKGVTEPEKTAGQYVVTPQLAAAFDDALGFIRDALESRRSKAAYLHGSFGSGKSHFMAILHLLLEGHSAVRRKPALAEVIDKHDPWTRGKKFLLVPFHMIGKASLRSAILGGYVSHLQGFHPEAPSPAVYLDTLVFENARALRKRMGDDTFFEAISAGKDARWGKLAKGWNAESFDRALTSPAGSQERARLVSDLVETLLLAFREVVKGKDEAFVELEDGLQVISKHAQSLGYDAVVFFLDELILWLASHAADAAFVEREGQSLVKLVEAQRAGCPVPIVSFIARQRDLRELVGKSLTGADQLKFQDIFQHWEDRFHTIRLEDRNLPIIAQERVLKPKDDAAEARIDAAFRETEKIRERVMEVLLTRESDRTMFRRLYPFSPAFIQALVAISGALQRERTALRILLEILIEERGRLKLGEIVPVGDLWDHVAAADAVFVDAMKADVENARRLLAQKLRPLLLEMHGVDPERDEKDASTNPEAAERLRRLRNDERLVKTLLLASIVGGVEALKSLTAERLAALNHGTIRAPFPGKETQVVLMKLKDWSQRVSEIQLTGDEGNPTVTLKLSSVDTDAIIEKGRTYDSQGARQSKVRQLLFESMGIADSDELLHTRDFTWRNTRRSAELVFGNVREMGLDALVSRGDGWKLVIDFPFDQEGFTARHDVDRVGEFRQKGEPTRTLVWLPSFFSRRAQDDLRKLVILDYLLQGENTLTLNTPHLSTAERLTARGLLENQQASLRKGLRELLEAAYGIRPAPPGGLDEPEDMSALHFHSLHPECALRPPAAGSNLGAALDDLLRQGLTAQFPRHPEFERPVKAADVRKVLDAAREAAGANPPRALVERQDRLAVKGIANPLRLGRMTDDGYFILDTEWRDRFNRKLHLAKKTSPTARDLRAWMDDDSDGRHGLPEEIENLLILVYAEQTSRSLLLHGSPAEGSIDRLLDDIELRQTRLPSDSDWEEARKRAGQLFGASPGQYVTAAQVTRLSGEIATVLGEHRAACDRLPGLIAKCAETAGMAPADAAKTARAVTARAAKDLIGALDRTEGTERVEALVRAKLATSPTALARSIKTSGNVEKALLEAKWDLFQAISRLDGDRAAPASIILGELRDALAADEYNQPIADVLGDAERQSVRLLAPPPPRVSEPQGWKVIRTISKDSLDADALRKETEEVLKLLESDPAARTEARWTIRRKEGGA